MKNPLWNHYSNFYSYFPLKNWNMLTSVNCCHPTLIRCWIIRNQKSPVGTLPRVHYSVFYSCKYLMSALQVFLSIVRFILSITIYNSSCTKCTLTCTVRSCLLNLKSDCRVCKMPCIKMTWKKHALGRKITEEIDKVQVILGNCLHCRGNR
jgi:hypothetical protein